MSFSIKLVDEYDWPVRVKVPVGGGVETHEFTARFRHLELDQVRKMVEQAMAAIPKDDQGMSAIVGAAQTQIEQAMAYWIGWGEDLQSADGNPVPYSEEAKRKLLGVRIIREAVAEAWQESQSGEAARLGNSDGSPAGGRVVDG